MTAMSSTFSFFTRCWTTVVAACRRNPLLAGGIALIHLTAMVVNFWTEWGPEHKAAFLLTWAILNGFWLALLRRPAISAALSLAFILTLIKVSQLKHGVLWLTVDFVDLMIIDYGTVNYLFMVMPSLKTIVLISLLFTTMGLLVLYYFDPFRVRRTVASAVAVLSLAGLIGLSTVFPTETYEGFYGNSYVSHFARTGVDAVSAFLKNGYMDSAEAVRDRLELANGSCAPASKPPHIILIHDESAFDARRIPGVQVPAGYADHFKSFDGKSREFIVEGNGGPSWYAEYNVLAGLSARSFGRFSYFVTRIADGRVERGLPMALRRCGYQTFTVFPTLGVFMSAAGFQRTVGVQNFIDARDMGTDVSQPDGFYYDHTAKLINRERANGPMFLYVYVAANHFPWDYKWRPELTPEWSDHGNHPIVEEYLRRQILGMGDFAEFRARLSLDFPDESFLIIRYGDHQPDFTATMIDPSADEAEITRRLVTYDPRYYATYYAIDAVNFEPVQSPVVMETIDGPYLPLVIQEAAGIPLDPSFGEQKSIMLRCKGLFYACKDGAEARRFNRLLIDAGLVHGL